MSYCHKTNRYKVSTQTNVGEDQVGKLYKIHKECADYATYNEGMAWLKKNSGATVRVVATYDGAAKIELVDQPGETGWAWQRELVPIVGAQAALL